MVRAVFTGWLTISGFDLARFSSLLSKHLSIFDLHGAIYIVIFLVAFFCLPRLVGLALDAVD